VQAAQSPRIDKPLMPMRFSGGDAWHSPASAGIAASAARTRLAAPPAQHRCNFLAA
jgi:hypothetical protein